MMTTYSDNLKLQPQLKKSQKLVQLLKNQRKSQLLNQLLFLMLKFMKLKQISINQLKKFQPDKLTDQFGTTNLKNLKLHSEFKSFNQDVSLKMLKFLLTTFSNQLKNGNKFNQSIWLACKNYDSIHLIIVINYTLIF